MAYKIDIVDTPRQSFSFDVGGREAIFEIYHSENIMGFILDLTYGSFHSRGIRLVNNYNILGRYSNLLPFGIQIYGAHDPFFQDDFSSGKNNFLLLEAAEVASL
jgi:hypothetical protein